MDGNTERFAARGEYEELREKEMNLRICLRSHVQSLHLAVPVLDLEGDICELRTSEAEVHLCNISKIKGELNTVLIRKKQLVEKWGFGRMRS